jgi:(+)-trans-carveol dehydrogenase
LGRLDGKVAFVTGAARGQGRSHAVRFAEEGADIIAVDICGPVDTALPTATAEDLEQTVELVEALDRRIVASQADVRDLGALGAALDVGVAELGRLDIVMANAGIVSFAATEEITSAAWQTMLDVNLTGVWHACKAAIPHLTAGGAIVMTSSAVGLKGVGGMSHYVAAKYGVVGLMRSLAHELGPRMIRVNCLCPGQVHTDMVLNEPMYRAFRPDLEEPTVEDFKAASQSTFLLPIPWLEPVDISNAALYLVSDEGRYVTGLAMSVDAGFVAK